MLGQQPEPSLKASQQSQQQAAFEACIAPCCIATAISTLSAPLHVRFQIAGQVTARHLRAVNRLAWPIRQARDANGLADRLCTSSHCRLAC